MKNILDLLVESSIRKMEEDKAAVPPDEMEAMCRALPVLDFEFERALKGPGLSFICEVKKASPSKGVISEEFPYLEVARAYEAGGAACVSVLTEREYFLGDDRYLREISEAVALPVLRKDFVTDPFQIFQARVLGAKAVLLIRAILTEGRLAALAALARELGMSALVEVHDEGELRSALAAGARLIGVNNRDLRTFEVDLGNSLRLREKTPADVVFVAESGISRREDVLALEAAGVDAALVGESLMRGGDAAAALRRLSLGL
ncbi:MAG: indole-3-glycerol phosphate synthase TrpC [Clostridiales Family XIII bacterium]|jgi:indole-3-glycerol phosphate synthase|nr:indole-3-glycerol phosphate synthase TrpC [Clostridiales Family XIII bacterium]